MNKQIKAGEFNSAAFIQSKGSTSAAIRSLLADGKTRSEVAKLLNVRYQHVRNVEVTPIKKEQRRIAVNSPVTTVTKEETQY